MGQHAQSIQDPRGTNLSQYDGTWARSAYFLRWRKPCEGREATVELVIFSPSLSLKSNLENLLARTEWEQAIVDPFCLLVVTLEHSFRQLDCAIWAVNSVFGPIENVRNANDLCDFGQLTSFRVYSHQRSRVQKSPTSTLLVYITSQNMSSISGRVLMRRGPPPVIYASGTIACLCNKRSRSRLISHKAFIRCFNTSWASLRSAN